MQHKTSYSSVLDLAAQLKLDVGLLYHELYWALGEERINRVTPTSDTFRKWCRQADGLEQFWLYANSKLAKPLEPEEVQDIWECIGLTLSAKRRRSFSFQDYLVLAVRSEPRCEICGMEPPEVRLQIDHILPVSKGGSNFTLNLRFLCEHHNRSRGNRFRWADVWRREA